MAVAAPFQQMFLADTPPHVQPPAGWTIISPTAPFGEGDTFSGAGSRIIYVSSSTGSDTNHGTFVSPVATIAHGATLLRSGFGDQLLLKCGDTWTNDRVGALHCNGVSPSGPWGTTITGPTLIGSYGAGARPLIRLDASAAFYQAAGGGGGAGFYRYMAFIGLEIYFYTRDPGNNPAQYSTSDAAINVMAFDLINTGAGGINPQYNLFEDLKISYAGRGIDFQGDTTALQNGHAVRRCVIVNCWTTTQATPGNVASGVIVDGCDNFLFEENFLDQNGYLQVGATVYSSTAWDGNDGPQLTHNLYLQYDCGLPSGNPWSPIGTTVAGTVVRGPNLLTKGNIFSRGLSEQIRSCGLIYNNLFAKNSSGWNAGYKGGLVQNNVCTEAASTWYTASPTVIDGAQFTFGTNTNESPGVGTGGPIYFDHNILSNQQAGSTANSIAYSGGSSYLASSLFLTGNIIFKGVDQETAPTGKVATNDTFVDASGSNSLGSPEPFPAPSRTGTSYAVSLGYASWDAFCTACRGQSRSNWNAQLTAAAVNDYIRAGFNR